MFDPGSRRGAFIDKLGAISTSQTRRIIGGGFGTTIDTTYLYNTTVAGSGGSSVSLGVATFSTGVTANSTTEIQSKTKIRSEFGKVNLYRVVARFGQSGAANNVTFIRLYVDANTEFGFRTNGAASATNFEVYYKKSGSITSIANGSFNGNGTLSSQTLTALLGVTFDPTIFHEYEIRYYYNGMVFYVDGVAVHSIKPTTTTLVPFLVGFMSIGSANSGGGTTNCSIDLIGWGGFQYGAVPNNPLWYNSDAVAETRTLKNGGGTLHDIIIGKKGGAADTLTVYDNTAASGTIIMKLDLQNVTGNQVIFNQLGLNFSTGLTYVTVGTSANITFLWE